MADDEYSAADITVLDFTDHVRRCPGMYFRVGPRSPEFATSVLCRVLSSALHPDTRLAPDHTLRVDVGISGDLAFAVTDDHAGQMDRQGRPRLGFHDSLLGADRWMTAAAAALARRAVVEVWRDGRGFRQALTALRPDSAPVRFEPPAGSGTRVAVELDPEYFGREAAIGDDLGSLDLHGPYCVEPGGPGHIVIRDARSGRSPTEWRYG
ncbi:hypothetical protein ACFWDQ_23355 [Streptomyces sp. NPDC060053]|uniref:hypothetical protein n=1 Tax=Streptomyces sp. NPDC060053 TaxID=3347047 RepID=UPI003679A7FC